MKRRRELPPDFSSTEFQMAIFRSFPEWPPKDRVLLSVPRNTWERLEYLYPPQRFKGDILILDIGSLPIIPKARAATDSVTIETIPEV